jgi:23S rRNA (cytidine1920-2'-O)/16S rRNA (cytidine1409-2'-O)-methyltransferase
VQVTRRRLDAELTRRGLARSREQARELIASGAVQVRGVAATKPATQVETSASITVDAGGPGYVSRGALKLIGALDAFGDERPARDGVDSGGGSAARIAPLTVTGRRVLDAGASTGGFTQVLLERGADRVLSVDVGYGQLAWVLRVDPRVDLLERTNVRTLTADAVPYLASMAVADLSFISLRTVLPALVASTASACDFVLMVKPQFEVGRAQVGDGVVRDPELRRSSVENVVRSAIGLGLALRGVVASPLPGPSGNVEYFVWLERGGTHAGLVDPVASIDAAVRRGPS